MNRQDFAEYMQSIFETKIQPLREDGQREYAHDAGNAFANFERAARALGLTREQVWAVYSQKHWDGIIAHIAGHRSQREPVQGRIRDMIVYPFLLHGMVDQEEEQSLPIIARSNFSTVSFADKNWDPPVQPDSRLPEKVSPQGGG